MRLVIEDVQFAGPNGWPVLSVAHYGEMNGDVMRDPEMLFELAEMASGGVEMFPYYYCNDYMGVEQESSRAADEPGKVVVNLRLKREHEAFARLWARNLVAQGYLRRLREAAARKGAA